MNNKETAYTLARVGLGIDITMHGAVRIPNIRTFVQGMATQFQNTALPPSVTAVFAMLLPFLELIVGLFILIGFFTRRALVTGTLIMFMLLFGTCLLQNWDGAGLQLGYIAFYVLLIYYVELNKMAVDNLWRSTSNYKNH